jgi:hypothetical protein
MGCESYIAQERRVQLQQHRVYKVTKNMAPTPTTYSLRPRGPPTASVERPIRLTTTRERPVRMSTATERPIQAQRVSTKVVENQDIEATQAQLAAKAVIDAFQPVIQALTMQLTQLTVALEEQKIDFAHQYKAL